MQGTRQRNLQLHVESLESLTKYLFTHDHESYTCLPLLYIRTIQETERQHSDILAKFVKGNFCVTKSVTGFTSISPDQWIEQESWTLYVIL